MKKLALFCIILPAKVVSEKLNESHEHSRVDFYPSDSVTL